MLRVITWNVARRRSDLVAQATALARRRPAIVALQEVTWQSLPEWRRAFALMGLDHVRSSLDGGRPSDHRRMGVMVASATPWHDVSHALAPPWPEAAVCAAAEVADTRVEVFCVHVPNAANGQIKPQTLDAVRDGVAAAGPGARIVCGDFNTPRRELPDGEVISFARDTRGRLRPDRGPAWDEAELGVVPGLRDLGYQDAFRSLHGYAHREPSWTWRRIAGHSGGWRLDHIFVSPPLRPVSCVYHHKWREAGFSDHSALEAELSLDEA